MCYYAKLNFTGDTRMAYKRNKDQSPDEPLERCAVPDNPNHVLHHPSKALALEQDVELSIADPIESIANAMAERGFSSLWTVPPKEHARTLVFDDDAKIAFLRKLAVGGRMAYAAQCVGVSVTCITYIRRKDKAFSEAIREALHYFRDLLQDEMFRRGVTGYKKQVLGGRNKDQIFEITEFSDRMMDTLAKIHIPALQKKQLEITGDLPVSGPQSITVNNTNNFDFSKMPVEDREQFKQLLMKQAKRIEDNDDIIDGEFTDAGSESTS